MSINASDATETRFSQAVFSKIMPLWRRIALCSIADTPLSAFKQRSNYITSQDSTKTGVRV